MPTFPTAFWQNKRPTSVGVGTEIDWETGLWWSYGDGSPALQNFSLQQSSNFPFFANVDEVLDEYYTDYEATTSNDYDKGTAASSYAYYGWFLDGGTDNQGAVDLSEWHRPQPWTVSAGGSGISIQNESDISTAWDSGYWHSDNYGPDFTLKTFNGFIQSGEATGSFTLSTTSNLTVQISGLGCDTSYTTAEPLDGQPYLSSAHRNSPFANHLVVSLYSGEAFPEEVLCCGAAPRDDRLISAGNLKDQLDLDGAPLHSNFDMQQVKLYSGSQVGIGSVVNTSQGDDTGEPRGNPNEWVDQNDRIEGGYTTAIGLGTFTPGNLGAGDYQLRIKVSTYDNIFNSGAFYGFKFNFSQP